MGSPRKGTTSPARIAGARLRTLAALGALALALLAPAGAAHAAQENACLTTKSTTPSTDPGGGHGWCGDGGPATRALLAFPEAVAATSESTFLIVDSGNDTIRGVDEDGIITNVAGNGSYGFSGDGGPATRARLRSPEDVAPLAGGGFAIADSGNNRVRAVDEDGQIRTIAGTGEAGFGGDGGPSTAAQLDRPGGLASLPDGGLLIADSANSRVRRLWPDGTITTVAGNGTNATSGEQATAAGGGGPDPTTGDGGPATEAPIDAFSVAAEPDGGFLVSGGSTVRRVAPDGTIETVAGGGPQGVFEEGALATQVDLFPLTGVTALEDGSFLVSARECCIERVNPDGTIYTLAGGPPCAFTGDGGFAIDAGFARPHDVAAVPGGGYLVVDYENSLIRQVFPDDTIDTVAGTAGAEALETGDCGASAEYDHFWNGFGITGVRGGRRLRVGFVTSLGATVTARAMRNHRTVARATRHVRPGYGRLVLRPRLRPGRYKIMLTAFRRTDHLHNAAGPRDVRIR